MARESIFAEDDRVAPLVVVDGTRGDDDLQGSPENDRLTGRRGNDTLSGLAGDDELVGGRGQDELHGGSGDDRLIGGGGADLLLGQGEDDVLQGGGGGDTLEGDVGNDALSGGRGSDFLRGGGGSDLLLGGGGRDELLGRSGLDRLDGGRGADVLAGGPDADVFQFTVLDGRLDRIIDFESIETGEPDTLDLGALVPISTTDADLDEFVRQTDRVDGRLIEVRSPGSDEFVEVVLIERTDLDDFTAQQLGLDDIPGDLATDEALPSTGMGSVASRVQQPGEQDWFRIELLAARSYEFNLEGAPDADGNLFPDGLGAPVLELRGADGSLLQADADGGPDTSLSLEVGSFDPGTYFIVARGADDAVGNYVLTSTVEFFPFDPGQLVIGGVREGVIAQDDQVDLYRLDLAAGDHVDVILESLEAPDPEATLLIADLSMLVTDPEGGLDGATVDVFRGGFGDRIIDTVEIDAASAGIYTIEISAFFAPPDPYRVTVVRDAPDSFAAAAVAAPMLGFDDGIAAGIGPEFGDVDWYRIELQAGHTYRFDLAGNWTGEGSLSGLGLELRDADNVLLGADQYFGFAEDTANIQLDATESGTFFLIAEGVSNRGSYTIRAEDLGATSALGASLQAADLLTADGSPSATSPIAGADAGAPGLDALLTAPDPAQAATG